MDSIPEIKKLLEKLDVSEYVHVLELYRDDDRIGVKKLIKVYENKISKHNSKIDKLNEMKLYEEFAYTRGFNLVAGIDEVGRGCFAGPVVTACVMLPRDFSVIGIDDSKRLKPEQRAYFFNIIKNQAIDVCTNFQSNDVIDEINILNATKLSMIESVKGLRDKPDYLIIDAVELDNLSNIEKLSLIKGDEKSISVASASIIAKITRDNFMNEMHKVYPQYNFDKNKGYGTKEHIEAIKKYGICPIHRKTFLKNFDI